MHKILITGGAGFIGSNLIHRLIENDDIEIVAVDNFDDFYPKQIKENNLKKFIDHPRFMLLTGDTFDEKVLSQFHDIDTIIHLAAIPGVRNSIEQSIKYQTTNSLGTNTLLEFAKNKKIKKFILASSSSVYGSNENVPWKESEYPNPISPYAVSKISAEMMGKAYSYLYDLQFIALRFFTVYGPAQRPDLAISSFFDCIYNNKPIKIFGDGSATRDYTYVDDIVSGIISAIDAEVKSFEVFNLGTTNTISINSLLSLIEDICGKTAKIEYLPMNAGEVKTTYADISKAQRILNYEPKTEIKQGLIKYHEWYQNNLLN